MHASDGPSYHKEETNYENPHTRPQSQIGGGENPSDDDRAENQWRNDTTPGYGRNYSGYDTKVLATPPISTIRVMDQTNWNNVKALLHIPISTQNFHCTAL